MNFLLAVCQRVEKEEIVEYRKISKFDFEIAENEVFIDAIISLDYFFLERDDTNIEDKLDDWKDKNTRKQKHKSETRTS